jgi:hypothetical protein
MESNQLAAASGYSATQYNTIQNLKAQLPGRFLGLLSELICLRASAHRAQDLARLVSIQYRGDLDSLVVADHATQEQVEGALGDARARFLRLDHIGPQPPLNQAMPHE